MTRDEFGLQVLSLILFYFVRICRFHCICLNGTKLKLLVKEIKPNILLRRKKLCLTENLTILMAVY